MENYTNQCARCNRPLTYKFPSQKRKFCSASCSTKFHVPFRKPFSSEARKKISLSKLGSKNSMWKGDSVGYAALHKWIMARLPKTEFCDLCHKIPPLDLANKSNNYRRDVTDWLWLCRRCHMLSDGRMSNLVVKDKNPRRAEKIKNLYNQGLRYKAIAKMLGITRQTVYYYIKNYSIPLLGPRVKRAKKASYDAVLDK